MIDQPDTKINCFCKAKLLVLLGPRAVRAEEQKGNIKNIKASPGFFEDHPVLFTYGRVLKRVGFPPLRARCPNSSR